MMSQQCEEKQLYLQGLGSRKVVADFDGGTISSDAGGLLLREVDMKCGILDRFAECFIDRREPGYAEHPVQQLVAQRVYGLCLGYEDLNDHELLRYDPLFATLCGQPDVQGQTRRHEADVGKALAGKATLQRLESAPAESAGVGRYHRIFHSRQRIEAFFVEHFLDHYNAGCQPGQIILDLDATDDPIHGSQEGRFFHGFYNSYCYLPLYIFCEGYLLAAKLRSSNIDASLGADSELDRIIRHIRNRWPKTRIIVRGDSGFAREWLMKWCEDNDVHYLFGLARNSRLQRAIGAVMHQARAQFSSTGKAARIYRDLTYRTRKSWSRVRRVVAKAEYITGKENPRFVVTSLRQKRYSAKRLYEQIYCARGEMENRIKEQQLYLFADRTSSATMRANQLRLWFSSVAYLLMHELRVRALCHGELARAQCHTIRTKVLKIGARVVISTRRIVVHISSGYPYQHLFSRAVHAIQAAAVP
jgi:hypothetical protein